ncbi:MAG: nucleotide exchange factor GrpE [Muribaculaceae bacterium]|nr:nucleotide exchange factor GrpE [Muribaculaceae bacterium]
MNTDDKEKSKKIYMDEVESIMDEVKEDNPVTEDTDEVTVESLQQQLVDAQAALEKEKKEYMFLMAEFDNFRKRTGREKVEIIKNANESAMKGLLPIVDDMERGIEANKTSDNAEAIKEGLELIYNKLVKYLESNGVKPIESTGTSFDPDLHNAIAMVPVEDDDLKGKVIDTPTKGYTINDKVLRHAMVAVGQ